VLLGQPFVKCRIEKSAYIARLSRALREWLDPSRRIQTLIPPACALRALMPAAAADPSCVCPPWNSFATPSPAHPLAWSLTSLHLTSAPPGRRQAAIL